MTFQIGNKNGKGRGETILCQIRTGDLCRLKGISKASLQRDMRLGRFNPKSLDDILRYITTPRTRANKGRPLPWLNPPKS